MARSLRTIQNNRIAFSTKDGPVGGGAASRRLGRRLWPVEVVRSGYRSLDSMRSAFPAGGHEKMIFIRGIIIPVTWDDEGNVSGLGIETFDEDFYLIEPLHCLNQLKPLLRRQVELSGALNRVAGKKAISVQGFRILT